MACRDAVRFSVMRCAMGQVQYSMVPCRVVQCDAVYYEAGAVWHDVVRGDAVTQYAGAVWHGSVQCGAV